MPTPNPSVPDVIWQQISLATKMACGARSPLGSGETLTFVVLSGKQYRIEVTLDPSDTYTVRYIKLTSRGTGYHVLEEATGVYCDSLSDVVYHMVNK